MIVFLPFLPQPRWCYYYHETDIRVPSISPPIMSESSPVESFRYPGPCTQCRGASTKLGRSVPIVLLRFSVSFVMRMFQSLSEPLGMFPELDGDHGVVPRRKSEYGVVIFVFAYCRSPRLSRVLVCFHLIYPKSGFMRMADAPYLQVTRHG